MERKPLELVCEICGEHFVFPTEDQRQFELKGWDPPKHCYSCRKELRKKREKREQDISNMKWQKQKEAEHFLFLKELKRWDVVSMDAIPTSAETLYIIGNGFDLMHGVKSSYYDFRDSMGKNNSLRDTLETYLSNENMWADFEAALGSFNFDAVMSRSSVIDALHFFDVFNEDSSAADYCMAQEFATYPLEEISNNLPKCFRKWVNSLTLGTIDRPLKQLIKNGKVLCFNYTEFIEQLYGIPKKNICYIHGCRTGKKTGTDSELILGHAPIHEYTLKQRKRHAKSYNQRLIDQAQENIIDRAIDLDQKLTKNCGEIMEMHKDFFDNLRATRSIVIVGHSMSKVDWDYFLRVRTALDNVKGVVWYVGCHGLHDLKNLEEMSEHIGIKKDSIKIFRTDEINVTLLPKNTISKAGKPGHNTRQLAESSDGKWVVLAMGKKICIISKDDDLEVYSIELPRYIDRACFMPDSKSFFVIPDFEIGGIYLYRYVKGNWHMINSLVGCDTQGLINKRLSNIFLQDEELTFVYNNRVRVFSMESGEQIKNIAVRNAIECEYSGANVTRLFLGRR